MKEQGVVIFVYPKANTGGCTKQACGFRDNYDAIKAAGYEVYGMSADNPGPQANWRAKCEMQVCWCPYTTTDFLFSAPSVATVHCHDAVGVHLNWDWHHLSVLLCAWTSTLCLKPLRRTADLL